jgi:hypothetical protein
MMQFPQDKITEILILKNYFPTENKSKGHLKTNVFSLIIQFQLQLKFAVGNTKTPLKPD